MARVISPKVASRLLAEARRRVLVWRLAAVLASVGLIALGAHLKVGGPIPFTLQTLFVLLAGALLGPLDAAAAVVVYLAAGAAGMPLFAGAGSATGLSYFAGSTGGYLVGFVLAAVVVGVVTTHTDRIWAHIAAFASGTLLILVLGVAHLCIAFKMPLGGALVVGFVPFVMGDVLKAAAAFGIYRGLRRSWKWLKNR